MSRPLKAKITKRMTHSAYAEANDGSLQTWLTSYYCVGGMPEVGQTGFLEYSEKENHWFFCSTPNPLHEGK